MPFKEVAARGPMLVWDRDGCRFGEAGFSLKKGGWLRGSIFCLVI